MKKLELFWPVKNVAINYPFGYKHEIYTNMGMAGHNGIDLNCFVGEPIYAAHDGLVTYAGVDSREGWGVVIRTNEPFLDDIKIPHYWKTISWHLLSNIPVKAGQSVQAGDVIGYGDTTGLATGPHLHFGLKPIAQGENEWSWYNILQQNGYFGAVDPAPYMSTLTAYQLKTTLKSISEILKKISELLTFWSKKR